MIEEKDTKLCTENCIQKLSTKLTVKVKKVGGTHI